MSDRVNVIEGNNAQLARQMQRMRDQMDKDRDFMKRDHGKAQFTYDFMITQEI